MKSSKKIQLIFLAAILTPSLANVLQAQDSWPYTIETIFEWTPKVPVASPVPVYMKIVRWADVFYADSDKKEIELIQVEGDAFEGCVNLSLLVNFAGIRINAEVVDLNVINLKPGGQWLVSLVPCAEPPAFSPGSTYLTVNTIHLTGAEKCLTLCVRVTGVDPQSHEFTPSAPVEVARVNLTMYPIGTP